MGHALSPALAVYARAFKNRNAPFLYHYSFNQDHSVVTRRISRGDFWILATKAATALQDYGLRAGDTQLHCFGANRSEDLIFRLGATMAGSVPVTVNWQADTPERVLYKIDRSGCNFLIHDESYNQDHLRVIVEKRPELQIYDTSGLAQYEPKVETSFAPELDGDHPKIIVFTSGTTGLPKGVRHSYGAYETSRSTFDTFLELKHATRFAVVVVNPLHHANATAICDWCLRHPAAELHLLERYTTPFWKILAEIVDGDYQRTVVPLTARHFDFLAELDRSGRLPLKTDRLKRTMHRVVFLMGSAPVGPTTVECIRHYAGRLPTVRFGSTETCLQVMGIPLSLSEKNKLEAFQRGWSYRNREQVGYFIGRPHPPFTEVRIFKSIRPGEPDFMVPVNEGEPGYIVTRGANLMTDYVNDPEATRAVFIRGWYTGLMDVGYFLINPQDGERDYYWMTRESALIIRGGANYACEQINHELASILSEGCGLAPESFDLAVVGLKVKKRTRRFCLRYRGLAR